MRRWGDEERGMGIVDEQVGGGGQERGIEEVQKKILRIKGREVTIVPQESRQNLNRRLRFTPGTPVWAKKQGLFWPCIILQAIGEYRNQKFEVLLNNDVVETMFNFLKAFELCKAQKNLDTAIRSKISIQKKQEFKNSYSNFVSSN